MLGRRDYETRKASRIARLQARAAAARAEGEGRLAGARRIADMIPFGQPILVGHHSERRHRRDIGKIHDGYAKGFAALKEADRLDAAAASAEENTAISSDDPEALTKLRAKLAALNADRTRGVALNKAARAKDPIAALAKLGVKDPAAMLARAQTHCFSWDKGKVVPSGRLTNMGAEARRLEKRIAELEARAVAPERAPEQIGAVRIEESENRVQLFFPGKPSESIRSALKSRGFRWSPRSGAWMRHASNGAWYAAREIAALASATDAT